MAEGTEKDGCAELDVPALDCAEELHLIRKGLTSLPGFRGATADYLKRRLFVEFAPGSLDVAVVSSRLQEIGFPARTPAAESKGSARSYAVDRTLLAGTLLLLAAFAVQGAAAAGWSLASAGNNALPFALAVAATLVAGLKVARAALRAVRLRSLDMNALMTIAALGALATGEVFEAATAMVLFGVALWLESYSLDRAHKAVRSVIELAPLTAHRLNADAVEEVPCDLLLPGELVLVRPGERIGIDGRVEDGESAVNEATITGESLPVEKAAGDLVYAGTYNAEGSLRVRVTRAAHESTLAHIARLVDQARRSRSPTERFVDSFARRYTPLVLVLAIMVAVLPNLLATWDVGWASAHSAIQWLHRGLVLLVIACPCALVISTPVTIVCGLHRAARRGMLIKGGQHLENAGRIRCMAFDKTGTVTTGDPSVVGVLGPWPPDEPNLAARRQLLQIAATLESHSEHPLARAIVNYASSQGVEPQSLAEFESLRGFGIRGQIDGQVYQVGSQRLFESDPGAAENSEAGIRWPDGDRGQWTTVMIGTPERAVGAILLADPPRSDAAAALAELRRLGVSPIVLLSGDHQAVVGRLAEELGFDEFHAELLPQHKVDEVVRLSRAHRGAVMVGDGVNDAPALAAATIGIALGSGSSDSAMETADVVIMTPSLPRVPELIRLGRRCRGILAQNIGLALGMKAAVLILAVAGPESLARLWLAVAADVGASLVVIANGMRLLGSRHAPRAVGIDNGNSPSSPGSQAKKSKAH